jgi:hypothetical protein
MAIEDGEAEVTRHGEHVANLGWATSSARWGCSKTLRNATVTAKTRWLVTLTAGTSSASGTSRAIEQVRATLGRGRRSMAARIVLFGATGYTGRLTAGPWSSAASGPCWPPEPGKLDALADEIGADGLETKAAA